MRILHIVHQYPPDMVGGTELYTRSIARELAARGHAVGILARRSAPGVGVDQADEEGVQVWRAWSGVATPTRRFLAWLRDPFLAQAFERVLASFRPDVVHLQHWMGWPVQAAGRLSQARIPYIVTLHDYWWVCANAQLITNDTRQLCGGPHAFINCARCALARAAVSGPHLSPALPPLAGLLAWRNKRLEQVLRSAACLIAPTDFVRRWYESQGVSSSKIHVLPHGIDYRAEPRRQEPGRPMRFAYVGGLAWQKGVHILVQAFAGIDGGELWIAGDDSAEPGYAASLQQQASAGVRFLGRLPPAQVRQMLAQVDVLLVPSLWYESFSLVVREAFAAGLPVVVSDLGALAESVRSEVDGLRVTPGDVPAWRAALERLMQEPHLLDRLRSHIQPPLDLAGHVERLESLYTQVFQA